MKGALIGLIIGLAILFLMYFSMKIYNTKGTIDIHLHDTYFVLSYASVAVFILLFLGTFFSVGGTIGTVFQSKWFWISAVLFVAIDLYNVVAFYKLFKKAEIIQFQMTDKTP